MINRVKTQFMNFCQHNLVGVQFQYFCHSNSIFDFIFVRYYRFDIFQQRLNQKIQSCKKNSIKKVLGLTFAKKSAEPQIKQNLLLLLTHLDVQTLLSS